MTPPLDGDKALRAAIIAALATSASSEATAQMSGASSQAKAAAITRQQVWLDSEGVVVNIPGLANQVRERPEAALARLRRADPNLRLNDISLDHRGFVVIRASTFRRGIKSIGDTNPGCNVNCYAGCT